MPETTGLTRTHLPEPTEYAPYYGKYIDLLEDRPLLDMLGEQIQGTLELLRSIPETKGGHRYAPDKWSIKEVVGHVIDAERVFGYRALRFSRGDATALPGFEQDSYVRAAGFDTRTLRALTDELEAVRRSTIFLFEGFSREAFARSGVASENRMSVRALGGVIAGHERHHVRVLRERYLV
jgi:hypothetical protein